MNNVKVEKTFEGSAVSRELARFEPGYVLRSVENERAIELYAPDGQICVQITLTPDGPRVELRAVALAVHTERALSIRCRDFEVCAERDIVLRAVGEIHSEAATQHHAASQGDIRVQAMHDVQLDGDRILLNSPKPGTSRRDLEPFGVLSRGSKTDVEDVEEV